MQLGRLLLISVRYKNASFVKSQDKLNRANKVFKSVGFGMIQRIIAGNQQHWDVDGVKIKTQSTSRISQRIGAVSNDNAVVLIGPGRFYGLNQRIPDSGGEVFA